MPEYPISLALIFSLGTHSEAEYKYKLSEFLDVTSTEIDDIIEKDQLYYSSGFDDFYNTILSEPKEQVQDRAVGISVLQDYILSNSSSDYETEVLDNTLYIYLNSEKSEFIRIKNVDNALQSISVATRLYVNHISKSVIYDAPTIYAPLIFAENIKFLSSMPSSCNRLLGLLKSIYSNIPDNFSKVVCDKSNLDLTIFKRHFKFFLRYKLAFNKKKFLKKFLVVYLLLNLVSEEDLKKLFKDKPNQFKIKVSNAYSVLLYPDFEILNKVNKYLK